MNPFTAIFLGLIQGLTEFLPVSSSGHLVIFQKIIPGFTQPGVLFDVILHLGTTLAVIYFFRKKIFSLSQKYIFLLLAGTVPTFVFGLLFRKQLEALFTSDGFLGFEFILTGILNFWVDLKPSKKSILNVKNAFVIGCAQALSIIPAISRSGMTIFTGTRLGIDKKKVAEYSFLMSIPAILGANLLEVLSHGTDGVGVSIYSYLGGFVASFVVGFLSISFLLRMLTQNKFKFFGFYTILLGVFVLIFLK